MLEYRIEADKEKDVQVYSLTFVKKEFLKQLTIIKKEKYLPKFKSN